MAQKSFHDGLVAILKELGGLEAYPDADPSIVDSIRQQILPVVQQGMAQEGMMPGQDPSSGMAMAPQGMPEGMPPMGMGSAAPMPVNQALGRLPQAAPDMREMSAAIERELAGTQAQNGATA